MRYLILAGLALAVSACGGSGGTAANDANAMAVDNMTVDENMMVDQNAMNGMDANMAVDANTQNMLIQDATTHDPDTNLANGI